MAEKTKGYRLHPVQIVVEIAIVTVGIVIAFQLSNWRVNRDRAKTESEVLGEIKSNLELDLYDINQNIYGHENRLKLIDTLRNYEQYEIPDERVGEHISRIFRDYVFIPQTGAFETLKAKGVDLIQNDSLRTRILRLYDFYYSAAVQVEGEWAPAQFYPDLRHIMDTYYDRFDVLNKIIQPKSPSTNWINNSDVQIRFDHCLNQIEFLLSIYHPLNEMVKGLISDIDKELKR